MKYRIAFLLSLLGMPMIISSGARAETAPAAAKKSAPLGDLSAYIAIAKDVQKIIKEGEFAFTLLQLRMGIY